MSELKKICVYCGSGPGNDPAYMAAGHAFGKILAENGIGLVYGGGSVGIMGAVAEAVEAGGGSVTGIIPDFLMRREHAQRGEHGLIVTRDMHERKRLMFEHADAFVALPGGIGTLEELVEQLTWAQLGRHRKPVLVANIKGFWNDFNMLVAETVEDILPTLRKALVGVDESDKTMKVARPHQL
jgi:uncharacterized protein (TIGR00730 family)